MAKTPVFSGFWPFFLSKTFPGKILCNFFEPMANLYSYYGESLRHILIPMPIYKKYVEMLIRRIRELEEENDFYAKVLAENEIENPYKESE